MKSKSNPLVWSLAFVVVTVSYGLSQNSRPPLFSTGVVSNSLTIGFPTQSGASYTIQAAADLANPDWTNTQTVAGTGAIVTVPTAITQQQQYFRLLISAPPASSLDPTQIGPPGSLYAYWNFNDLSVSNAVTAWTDRINGIVLQPPGVPPVDTALGVYFNSTPDPLTNSALAIGSNFTLWIVFRPNMIDSNARVVFGTAAGQGLVISNGLLYGDWDSTNMLSVPLNHAYPGDTNETFDLIDERFALHGRSGPAQRLFPLLRPGQRHQHEQFLRLRSVCGHLDQLPVHPKRCHGFGHLGQHQRRHQRHRRFVGLVSVG
jgi:hypothetical protein